jgi:hypothetical protein
MIMEKSGVVRHYVLIGRTGAKIHAFAAVPSLI